MTLHQARAPSRYKQTTYQYPLPPRVSLHDLTSPLSHSANLCLTTSRSLTNPQTYQTHCNLPLLFHCLALGPTPLPVIRRRMLLQKKSRLQLSFRDMKELPQRPLLLGIHCPQSSRCLQGLYRGSFVRKDLNPCRIPLPFQPVSQNLHH